jgi:hypothetical protein
MTDSKPSLAILAVSSELYATYLATLAETLSAHFTVKVIYLNNGLLREHSRYAIKTLNKHLDEIADELNRHSAAIISINVRLWGSRISYAKQNILRLLSRYTGKALFFMGFIPTDNFSLAFRVHEILSQNRHRLRTEVKKLLLDWNITRSTNAIWKALVAAISTGRGSMIVFNARKLRLWQLMYSFRQGSWAQAPVFFTKAERRHRTHPDAIAATRRKLGIGTQDIVIAALGDITKYSGLKTLIQAFARLPSHYKLIICGNDTEKAEARHSHRDVYIDVVNRYLKDRENKTPAARETGLVPNRLATLAQLFKIINRRNVDMERELSKLSVDNFRELSEREENIPRLLDEIALALPDPSDHMRIRFIKPKSFETSFEVMAAADACVFCEQEVDAVHNLYLAASAELNGQIFVSYNLLHREFERFYPGKLTYFDLGNDLELAQKLARLPQDGTRLPPVAIASADTTAQAESIREIVEQLLATHPRTP